MSGSLTRSWREVVSWTWMWLQRKTTMLQFFKACSPWSIVICEYKTIYVETFYFIAFMYYIKTFSWIRMTQLLDSHDFKFWAFGHTPGWMTLGLSPVLLLSLHLLAVWKILSYMNDFHVCTLKVLKFI